MGPREGFPWFGKNLSLTGQAGTPEAFPDTPMPLPYGFLVLSSQRVVRAGDQALFFPPPPLPRESWLGQGVTTLSGGIEYPAGVRFPSGQLFQGERAEWGWGCSDLRGGPSLLTLFWGSAAPSFLLAAASHCSFCPHFSPSTAPPSPDVTPGRPGLILFPILILPSCS